MNFHLLGAINYSRLPIATFNPAFLYINTSF